jgi:tetratricopeptide (TPR) repeat protein
MGAEVKVQEDFQQHGHTLLEALQEYIVGCDRVIALVGDAYGFEPDEPARPAGRPRRSYTQWEYFFARGERLDGPQAPPRPVYVYFARDEYLAQHPPPKDQTPEQAEWQRQFRAEIRASGKHWSRFGSLHELRASALRDGFQVRDPDRRPTNLPYRSLGTLFKGRDAFLDDLRRKLLGPGGRAAAIVAPLALHGLGGVGKTRAAVEYAWRHADDYSALLFVSAPSVSDLRTNLANLAGVFGAGQAGMPLEQQLAEVLRWLDDHPGWLLIIDNVDTEEAAREVEGLLASLRAGHVLITSRIGSWSAGVDRLDLHVLAPADAIAFLVERAANRRQAPDDAAQAAAIARELDGLALALEQAAAYVEEESLSFAEYLQHWQAKRKEVLEWHDERLMQYPRSVAITWETSFERLPAPARRLLGVLAWLAPEPIPLTLFDAAPLVEAVAEPRKALGNLKRYSLARFDAAGASVLVHRLVQEIARRLGPEADGDDVLRIALEAVNAVALGEPWDVRTWDVWTPLAVHAEAVTRYADAAGLPEPTGQLMVKLGLYWKARGLFDPAEPLYRRSLAIAEQSYGPDHPDVAIRLNNLAELLRATDRLAEAEPLFRRCLQILIEFQRRTGHQHPNFRAGRENYVDFLESMGKTPEQIEQHLDALVRSPRSDGS